MKIALISSGNVPVSDLKDYLPTETTQIISISEQSINESSREYIKKRGISMTEYEMKQETLDGNENMRQNIEMLKDVEKILAFWNGTNIRTKKLIDICNWMKIPIRVYV